MRVRWTTPAADDLYNIVQHIQRDNPDAAADVAESRYDGCGNLRKFPILVVRGGSNAPANWCLPYIVVYRIQDQIVEIMRIYHGAQDWP